jgi:dTDP-glucose pyrophosphorylase
VLAVSKGTRLRPLIGDRSKGIVGIAGQLLLAHCFESLLKRIGDNRLIKAVPTEEAGRYGVCDTDQCGEVVEVVENPDNPPSNPMTTGRYTFTPAMFHACHIVQPSDRGGYELSEVVNLLLQSRRTMDAIGLEGRRVNVGYPEDRDETEQRLETDIESTTE